MPPPPSPMRVYRVKRDSLRPRVVDKYEVLGFISSGTYGRVYKARQRANPSSCMEYAIKKFKPDKEGETQTYTGISQSACREIALCREVKHENIIDLTEVMLEDKSIYMIFEFAEHDFLQIIHHHNHVERKPIPESIVKSFLWQLINGVSYLHSNWILHRDLKPANILVTAGGVIKIGDLGLARLFNRPLQPLFNGDKVVVTIWYRAPELLLGSRHYTPAIDLWAIGCIFAELLSLRPIFKGEELKMDTKKNVPFQKPQLTKIFEVLGSPTRERWLTIDQQPEYPSLLSMRPNGNYALKSWYQAAGARSESGFELLARLFEYDPNTRITADEALNHPYWNEEPVPSLNSFAGQQIAYPTRRVSVEDKDMRGGTKHTLGGVGNPNSTKDDRNTKRPRIA